MSNHEALTAALLAAFNLDSDSADPAAVAGAAATVLLAFADAVRGPAPVAGELVAAELIADETPALILAELRKQTTLLEVLAKQGDQPLRVGMDFTAGGPVAHAINVATGAAASGLPG